MADRVTIIPPRDPWPFSTVTTGDLEDLVAEGLLRPLSDEGIALFLIETKVERCAK